MIHTITSFGLIPVVIFIAFGLTALVTVMIANVMAARQERQEREPRPGPPTQNPDSAAFKRGA